MDPEDDYETWATILGIVEPNGDYVSLLPGYERLLKAYCSDGVLTEPLSGSTNMFAESTMRNVVNEILSLGKLTNPMFSEQNRTFLARILPVLIEGVIKGRSGCDRCVLQIVDKKCNFYSKNESWTAGKTVASCPNYEAVVQKLMEEEGALDQLLRGIKENGTIRLFQFLAKLIEGLGYVVVPGSRREVIVKEVSGALMKLLGAYNAANLRELDPKVLSEVLIFIEQGISSTSGEPDFVRFLLEFGNMCLRSEILTMQLIGAKLISKMAIQRDLFKQWAIETGLIPYLIKGKLNGKVIQALESCASIVMAEEKQSIDSLLEMYNQAEHAHSSQKTTMNSFLAHALKSADKDVTIQFLERITNGGNVTVDMINFLTMFVTQARFSNEESIPFVMNFILKLLDSYQDEELVNHAIDQIVKAVLPKSAGTMLFYYLREKIQVLPAAGKRFKCYKKLAKCVVTLGPEWREAMMQVLIACMQKDQEHVISYLSFLATILRHSQSKLPEDGVVYLTCCAEAWGIFGKLLQKRGLGFLDGGSVQTIFRALESLDYGNVTLQQYQVIQILVVANAIANKNLEPYIAATSSLNLKDYRVKEPMVEGWLYIFNVITKATLENVSDVALAFLLELFRAAHMSSYCLLAGRLVDELRRVNVTDQGTCARFLKIANAFITTFELVYDMAQFGLQRHKSIHKKYIKLRIQYNATTFELECSPHILGSDLSRMVALKLRKKTNNTAYLKYGSEYVSWSEPISAKGIRDGALLTIYQEQSMVDDPNFPESCMTSVLGKDDIVEKIYGLIQRNDLIPDLKRTAWKFLMLMPTAISVRKLTDDESSLLQAIRSAATEMQLRYLLQCVCAMNIHGCASVIFDMLVEGRVTKFSMYDALMIVKSELSKTSDETAAGFSAFCVKALANSDLSLFGATLIDMLLLLVSLHMEQVCRAFLQESESFRLIVIHLESKAMGQLVQVFSAFTSYNKELFDMLVSFFDDVKSDKSRISEYFKLVSAVFNSSCDVEKSVKFAAALLDSPETALYESICQFLNTVLSMNPDACQNNVYLFDRFVKELFECSRTSAQESMLNILTLFGNQNDQCKEKLKQTCLKHFHFVTDQWGYDPANHNKSSTGFVGLRNLGATCYMNSVFQQLFFNSYFRNAILKSSPAVDWQQAFRAILARLLKSNTPYVDTAPFAKVWRVEGDELVNPRIQQDAVEFFLLLMDRLGDKWYKGEMSNIMLGAVESDGFKRSSPEDFWTLPLVVLGQKSFDDSLQCFLEKETVSGYHAESLGRTIDIVKFTRVHKAPDFLVLQLKRFEYDMATWNRYKVNDKFEFPMTFDLAKLMEDDTQHQEYKLTGIVVHNGTAQGGHYTSYIRRGDHWYLFNDTNVNEVPYATVLEESVGGKKQVTDYDDHLPSAYLLFYAKKEMADQPEDNEEVEAYLRQHDQDLLHQIQEENKQHLTMQALFGTAFMNFILKSDDLDLLIPYMFNIFAHSHHTAMATKFASHVIDVIRGSEAGDKVMQAIVDQTQESMAILVQCTTHEVLTAFVSVVKFVIQSSDARISVNYFRSLFDGLLNVIQNWRAIPIYLDLITTFACNNRDFVESEEKGFASRLVEIMETAFGSTSNVFLQNIDFSSVFLFFANNLQAVKLSASDVERLCSMGPIVMRSMAHSEQYLDLIVQLANKELVNLDGFLDNMLTKIKDPSSPYVVSLFIALARDDNMCMKFLNYSRISKDEMVKNLRSILGQTGSTQREALRNKLIKHGKVLFYLITCGSPSAISGMEQLYLQVYKKVPCLDSWTRAESLLSSTDVSSKYVSSYSRWYDRSSGLLAEGEDLTNLSATLDAAFEGIRDINAKPAAFIAGSIAFQCLTYMIRVVYWMLLRTGRVLTEDECSVVLDLFDTLHKQNLEHDCNIIELIKLLSFLPPQGSRAFTARFDDLVRDVFSVDWSYSKKTCIPYVSSLFFDMLSEHLNAELFAKLIASPLFAKSFEYMANSPCASFTTIVEVVRSRHLNMQPLVMKYRIELAVNHSTCLNSLVSACEGLTLEQFYQTLLIALLDNIAAPTNIDIRVACTTILEHIQTVELSNTEPIVAHIDAAVMGLSNPTAKSTSEAVLLLTELAKKSREVAEKMFGAVQKVQPPTMPIFILTILLEKAINGEFNMETVAKAVHAYKETGSSRDCDKLLFEILKTLFDTRGITSNLEWAEFFFSNLTQCSALSKEQNDFVQYLAKVLPSENILAVVSTWNAKELGAILYRLNSILQQRPELRDPCLSAVGFTGEKYEELRHRYGKNYSHIFSPKPTESGQPRAEPTSANPQQGAQSNQPFYGAE